MPDEVLLRDPFCPGYVDSIGNWNNGFACPPGEAEPLYCCGTATYRYCCPASVGEGTERGAAPVPANSSSLPLILGIVFGVLVSTVLVVTALFFGWRTWRAHKKRPRTGGQLFCVAGGGTPSLYTGTFSRETSRLGSPQLGDDVLRTVDEVAVRQPYRFASPVSRPATTSFTADFGHRALLSGSSESTTSSSASDSTMEQLYASVRQPPPAYSFRSETPRTLSLSPPGSISKPELDFRESSFVTSAEMDVLRHNRSRSSSLFKSTRF